MSEHEDETTPEGGISDEMLPEDLRPTDDNPLAKPLDEDEAEQVPGATEDDHQAATGGDDDGTS